VAASYTAVAVKIGITAWTQGRSAPATPVPLPRTADDEASLVAAMRAGDTLALDRLYERHSRGVYSLALHLLGDAAAAEDVVQETFLKLWRQPAAYDERRGRLLPWLLGVAHHHAVDQLRRRRLERRYRAVGQDGTDGVELLDAIELASVDGDPHARASAGEARQTVMLALGKLPAEQRVPLELAYYRGLTQSEIARHLQEPLGTVKTRMRLGLQRLRAMPSLADLWGER
jgi:RNA polymerase sigma-70 factor, ECF subfamily